MRRHTPMEIHPPVKDKRDVEGVIRAFFEAGKNKDLAALAGFHAPEDFTKFDENPPYTRQDSEEAFVYEQAAFASISDYSYSINDLRVDFLGEAAVATFYLTYSGMVVNDYSFEGSTLSGKARVTMVLTLTEKGWKIAHEHLSSFPDWVAPKKK